MHQPSKESSRLRTVACSFYQNGNCKWGDQCTFLHAEIKPTGQGKPTLPLNTKTSADFGAWAENNISKWRVDSVHDNLSDKFRFSVPSPAPADGGDCIFYSSDSDMEWDHCDDRQLNRLQSTTLELKCCQSCNMNLLSGETGKVFCVYCGQTNSEPLDPLIPLQALFNEQNPPVHQNLSVISAPKSKLANTTESSQTSVKVTSSNNNVSLKTLNQKQKKRETSRQNDNTFVHTNKFENLTSAEIPIQEDENDEAVDVDRPIPVIQSIKKKKKRRKGDVEVENTPEGVRVYRRLEDEQKVEEDDKPPPPPEKSTKNHTSKDGTKRKRNKNKSKVCEPNIKHEFEKDAQRAVADKKLPNLYLPSFKDLPIPNLSNLPLPNINVADIKLGILTITSIVATLLIFSFEVSCLMVKTTVRFLSISIPFLFQVMLITVLFGAAMALRGIFYVYKLVNGVLRKLRVYYIVTWFLHLTFGSLVYPYLYASYLWEIGMNLVYVEGQVPNISVSKFLQLMPPVNEATKELLQEAKELDAMDQGSAVLKLFKDALKNPSLDKNAIYSARANFLSKRNKHLPSLLDIARMSSLGLDDLALAALSYASQGLTDKATDIVGFCRAHIEPGQHLPDLVTAEVRLKSFELLDKCSDPETFFSKASEYLASTTTSWGCMAFVEGAAKWQLGSILEELSNVMSTKKFCKAQNNYITALQHFANGRFTQARNYLIQCYCQNYKPKKCKELAERCWWFTYYISMCSFTDILGLGNKFDGYVIELEKLPHQNLYMATKLKLLRGQGYFKRNELSLAKNLLESSINDHPLLYSSFALLKAQILYREENYDASNDILSIIQDDPLVERSAKLLLLDIKKYLEIESKKTHYSVLGLETTATEAEIKDAYRALAKKNHPDKFTSDNTSKQERLMKQLNAAYAVLKDPETRLEYDRSMGVKEESSPTTDNVNESDEMKMCKEEMLDAARRWWKKRSGKLRAVAEPSGEQVVNFLKTYIKEKRGHLWNKYRLNQDDLNVCLADLINN